MYFLGIHLEGAIVKTVLLKKEKGSLRIQRLDSVDVKRFDKTWDPETLLVSGLEGWKMLHRRLQIKVANRRALASVLPLQIEALLPQPTEEMVVLTHIESCDEKGAELSVCAASHSEVRSHLEQLESIGVKPDVLSCLPAALLRVARFLFPEKTHIGVFHCGLERSSYIVIDQGKLLLSQSFPVGARQLQEGEIGSFEKECERMLQFLEIKNATPPHFLITGYKPVQEIITRMASGTFALLSAPEIENHAGALGLALDAALQDDSSTQFLQGAFTPERTKRSRRKRMLRYLLSSCLFAASLAAGLQLWCYKKERAIEESIASYIEQKGDLETALDSWANKLAEEPAASFPYLNTAPKVTDLLAWISSHPILSKGEISIAKLRYTLTKYPTLEKAGEPYGVRVEIAFTATTPRIAREFHDALLQGDALVNPKPEIGWQVQNDLYTTSFFVKNAYAP